MRISTLPDKHIVHRSLVIQKSDSYYIQAYKTLKSLIVLTTLSQRSALSSSRSSPNVTSPLQLCVCLALASGVAQGGAFASSVEPHQSRRNVSFCNSLWVPILLLFHNSYIKTMQKQKSPSNAEKRNFQPELRRTHIEATSGGFDHMRQHLTLNALFYWCLDY